MHYLSKEEMKKRGCEYCTEKIRSKEFCEERGYKKYKSVCKHEECPYHELNPFNTYEEYLEQTSPNFHLPN